MQEGIIPDPIYSAKHNGTSILNIDYKFYNTYNKDRYTKPSFRGIITHAAMSYDRYEWHPETFDNIGFCLNREEKQKGLVIVNGKQCVF